MNESASLLISQPRVIFPTWRTFIEVDIAMRMYHFIPLHGERLNTHEQSSYNHYYILNLTRHPIPHLWGRNASYEMPVASIAGKSGITKLPCMSPSAAEPDYFRITRSISWLMVTLLRMSPGQQQPWHWIYRINESMSSIRKDIYFLCHLSVEKWSIIEICFEIYVTHQQWKIIML